jgi:hypothetical protein
MLVVVGNGNAWSVDASNAHPPAPGAHAHLDQGSCGVGVTFQARPCRTSNEWSCCADLQHMPCRNFCCKSMLY